MKPYSDVANTKTFPNVFLDYSLFFFFSLSGSDNVCFILLIFRIFFFFFQMEVLVVSLFHRKFHKGNCCKQTWSDPCFVKLSLYTH